MKIKGFDKDLKCRGFQFEVGKEYDTDAADEKIKLCTDTVFHYSDSLQKVHVYYSVYPNANNRFCEIEVLGAEITDGEKCGSNRIRVVREITGAELDSLRGFSNGNTGIFNTGSCNTGNCNAGYCNTGGFNTGSCNTGYRNAGHCNTGGFNTGNCNTGYRNVGDYNTGDHNTGNCNTGYRNVGDYNTGMFNICNFSSGFFCTVEPKAKVFDTELDMTVSDFRKTKYYEMLTKHALPLTEWIFYTEEEQQQDEEKKRIGGYLKERTFKEACALWWGQYSKAEKAVIMDMPNFDARKFEKITGIDIDNDTGTAEARTARVDTSFDDIGEGRYGQGADSM